MNGYSTQVVAHFFYFNCVVVNRLGVERQKLDSVTHDLSAGVKMKNSIFQETAQKPFERSHADTQQYLSPAAIPSLLCLTLQDLASSKKDIWSLIKPFRSTAACFTAGSGHISVSTGRVWIFLSHSALPQLLRSNPSQNNSCTKCVSQC